MTMKAYEMFEREIDGVVVKVGVSEQDGSAVMVLFENLQLNMTAEDRRWLHKHLKIRHDRMREALETASTNTQGKRYLIKEIE